MDSPRRVTVRCTKHGIQYNPSRTKGCEVCLREEQNARQSCDIHDTIYDSAEGCPDCRRELSGSGQNGVSRSWVSFIAVALIATAIGVWYYRSGGSSNSADGWNPLPETNEPEGAVAEAIPQPGASSSNSKVVDSGRLDPEPFRERIESLESILFNRNSSDPVTADRTATEARELSIQVQRSHSSQIHRQAAGAILVFAGQLAGQIGTEADTGFAAVDLSPTRRQWENLRNSHFDHAGWFHQSNSRFAEREPRAPRIDSKMVTQLSRVAGEIVSLISEGRPAAEKMGEPYVDAPPRSRELDLLVRQWRNWSRTWSRRVMGLGNQMPGEPTSDSDMRLLKAYNNLNSALQQLASVPHPANDSGVPFQSSRRNRFDQAILLASESQEILSILRE